MHACVLYVHILTYKLTSLWFTTRCVGFSYDVEYSYLEELERLPSVSAAKSDEAEAVGGAEGGAEVGPMATEQVASLSRQWALLEFEQPVTCPPDCIVIGSRLDFDAYILSPWNHG